MNHAATSLKNTYHCRLCEAHLPWIRSRNVETVAVCAPDVPTEICDRSQDWYSFSPGCSEYLVGKKNEYQNVKEAIKNLFLVDASSF